MSYARLLAFSCPSLKDRLASLIALTLLRIGPHTQGKVKAFIAACGQRLGALVVAASKSQLRYITCTSRLTDANNHTPLDKQKQGQTQRPVAAEEHG
jgi:hypothetical protein